MPRDFDAVDDAMNCGSDASLDNAQPFTLSAWINPRTLGEGNYGVIMQKYSGLSGYWTWNLQATDRMRFLKDTSGPTDLSVQSGSNSIKFRTWQHVAVSWNGAVQATGVKMYIDAVETSYFVQTAGIGTNVSDASNELEIGVSVADALSFDGRIAYVQFHKRVLTVDEIARIRLFPGSVTQDLVGFWPLWGGSPESDYSGYGNHGAIIGATLSSDGPPIVGVFTPLDWSGEYSFLAAPVGTGFKINDTWPYPMILQFTAVPPAPSPGPAVVTGRKPSRMLVGVGR